MLGLCTDEEYRVLLDVCPPVERTFVENGIMLIKYWFEVGRIPLGEPRE